MKKGWKVLSSIVISASLATLSACASSPSSGGGDGSSKNITIYSPETPDMTKELAEAFEKASKKKVNVQYAGTNILVNRMIAEKDSPKGDVWYGGGGSLPFETAADKGIIMPYTPKMAKEWQTKENGVKVRDKNWKWVGTEIFVLGFTYNTKLVKKEDAPKTWDDLLNPKWKGKIQFSNPAASGTATLMVLSQMMERGEAKGWDYFKKLYAQANATPDSGAAPTKAVAMGEAEIGIGFDFMAYEQKAKGEEVDFVVPDKTPILVNPVSLVEKGPNPKGGKELIDFLLSKDGQQILANWYHIPINPEVKSKTPLSLKSVQSHALDLDIDWVVNNYDRVRTEWPEKIK